jgi:hypothetical protein
MVNQRTVWGIFEGVDGVNAQWTALYFGQGEECPSLHDHAVFRTFLHESSLGGLDPALLYSIDYRDKSEAWQPATRKGEERVRAWKFEAVIDAVHHTDLIDARGEILSDYFYLHILQHIKNWELRQAAWDLISYSIQRNIFGEHARDSVHVM